MPRRAPRLVRLLRSALREWSRAGIPRRGAALAYYTLFAIAPMLLIVIGIAGLAWGEEAVRGELVGQIDQLVGHNGAELIEQLLVSARGTDRGTLATVLGGVTLFLGATGAFLQLQDALNRIWRVEQRPGNNIVRFVIDRLRSFGMVVGLGFLLLISLAVDAGLAAASTWADARLPDIPWVFEVLNVVVALAVVTMIFALVYRILPDVHLSWSDVWLGAGITAVLFTIGKRLIGLYLGQTTPASAYGAAGSAVIIMVWVYFSAQLVLLGAIVTRMIVMARKGRAVPTEIAVKRDAVPAA